jgi:hypothetical protein
MIEVYNFLDGKNLCNIFASLIVEKINETFPYAITEISVINVRNFFVIKGTTNSDVIVNCANILKEFIEKYDEEISKTIRVIDIIQYSVGPNIKTSFICNYHFKKENYNELQEFIDQKAKEQIYLNLKIDDINKIVFYSSNKDKNETIGLISNFFDGYQYYEYNFENEQYVSDKFFGLSNNGEKLYHMLLKYVWFNVSSLGITKELNVQLSSNEKISNIDNLNINFDILNDNHIVKTSWLESLILDVFPFEYSELEKSFDLNEYSVLNTESPKPWEKYDRINELVLI